MTDPLKDTALTENTAPLGSDLERMVDDPGGSPLSQRIYKGSNNLLPDGYMINGKLSVTVSSNNLTVALKTKSGGNPSATDPVSVWINGSYRRCTAALSVTINAGANSFNAGGAELATKEVDYFVYLIWNTTPATDIMDLGVSRYPGGRLYSDFSGTATNEKYLAHANASAPAAGDDCIVIGRFAATLSAGAGYTWTVPTFTNTNLIQSPTYETRWLTWQPVYTGFSADPAGIYRYKIDENTLSYLYKDSTLGTSNATTYTATLPFTPVNVAGLEWQSLPGYTVDNGGAVTSPGLVSINANVAYATFYKTMAAGAWTGSGTKGLQGGTQGFYEI